MFGPAFLLIMLMVGTTAYGFGRRAPAMAALSAVAGVLLCTWMTLVWADMVRDRTLAALTWDEVVLVSALPAAVYAASAMVSKQVRWHGWGWLWLAMPFPAGVVVLAMGQAEGVSAPLAFSLMAWTTAALPAARIDAVGAGKAIVRLAALPVAVLAVYMISIVPVVALSGGLDAFEQPSVQAWRFDVEAEGPYSVMLRWNGTDATWHALAARTGADVQGSTLWLNGTGSETWYAKVGRSIDGDIDTWGDAWIDTGGVRLRYHITVEDDGCFADVDGEVTGTGWSAAPSRGCV